MYASVDAPNRGIVVLGTNLTCIESEHLYWGSSCQILRLNTSDNHHCSDCGLVYKKPTVLDQPIGLSVRINACACEELRHVVKPVFSDFYGYECPETRYQCTKCERHYEAPALASIELQESEAAKRYVEKCSTVGDEKREYLVLVAIDISL
ncbi:MAG: hypothetical protein JWN50_293 [Parcubacteria group bacterium]|nr:hypothetical protein [Parcubacteria group bacterium]